MEEHPPPLQHTHPKQQGSLAGPEGQQCLDPSAEARAVVAWIAGAGVEWRKGEGRGPLVSLFNLALTLAESLRRGAPPQVEETQPMCLHTPLAERYSPHPSAWLAP